MPGRFLSNRKHVFFLFKLSVSLFLLTYVFHIINPDMLFEAAKAINPFYFSIALLFGFIQIVFNSFRWRLILSSMNLSVPYSKVYKSYYTASFLNLFLPGTFGGDAYRIVSYQKKSISLKDSAISVFIERLASALGLFLLVLITYPLLLIYIDAAQLKLQI